MPNYVARAPNRAFMLLNSAFSHLNGSAILDGSAARLAK
jgi:hypothetical protein